MLAQTAHDCLFSFVGFVLFRFSFLHVRRFVFLNGLVRTADNFFERIALAVRTAYDFLEWIA